MNDNLVDLLVLLKNRMETIIVEWVNGDINDRAIVLRLVEIKQELYLLTKLASEKSIDLLNTKQALQTIMKEVKGG